MKKLTEKLNSIGPLPIRYLKFSLKLVYLCAAVMIIYYVVLDSGCGISYRDTVTAKKSLEYIAASLCIALSGGLLLDLYIKKQ